MVVLCRAIAHLLRVSKRDGQGRGLRGRSAAPTMRGGRRLMSFPQRTKGERMRAIATAIMVVLGLVMLPAPSSGQALGTITGVVKDSSGAVLPGATVEASSPALIEKTRTVVTDGSGQYRIVSL